MHTYTYIHTYIHSHIYIYIQIHTYNHTTIHTYIHTYNQPYIQPYIHTYIQPYIHSNICMYIYMRAFINTLKAIQPQTSQTYLVRFRRKPIIIVQETWLLSRSKRGLRFFPVRWDDEDGFRGYNRRRELLPMAYDGPMWWVVEQRHGSPAVRQKVSWKSFGHCMTITSLNDNWGEKVNAGDWK